MRRGTKSLLILFSVYGALFVGLSAAYVLGTWKRQEREAQEPKVSIDLVGLNPLVGTLTIDDHIFELQRADQVRLRDIRQLKHRIETLEKQLKITPPVFDSEGWPVDGFKE